MKARALIESDIKSELLLDRGGPVKPWREELYDLGFEPTVYDEDLGQKFPISFKREWNGHDIVIDYLYAVRQWVVKMDGMRVGMPWKSFEDFLWYLNEKILVARFDASNA